MRSRCNAAIGRRRAQDRLPCRASAVLDLRDRVDFGARQVPVGVRAVAVGQLDWVQHRHPEVVPVHRSVVAELGREPVGPGRYQAVGTQQRGRRVWVCPPRLHRWVPFAACHDGLALHPCGVDDLDQVAVGRFHPQPVRPAQPRPQLLGAPPVARPTGGESQRHPAPRRRPCQGSEVGGRWRRHMHSVPDRTPSHDEISTGTPRLPACPHKPTIRYREGRSPSPIVLCQTSR